MHACLAGPPVVATGAPRERAANADALYGCVDWYFYEPPPVTPHIAPCPEMSAGQIDTLPERDTHT